MLRIDLRVTQDLCSVSMRKLEQLMKNAWLGVLNGWRRGKKQSY
jgi:hypothetical protein